MPSSSRFVSGRTPITTAAPGRMNRLHRGAVMSYSKLQLHVAHERAASTGSASVPLALSVRRTRTIERAPSTLASGTLALPALTQLQTAIAFESDDRASKRTNEHGDQFNLRDKAHAARHARRGRWAGEYVSSRFLILMRLQPTPGASTSLEESAREINASGRNLFYRRVSLGMVMILRRRGTTGVLKLRNCWCRVPSIKASDWCLRPSLRAARVTLPFSISKACLINLAS